MGSDKLDEAVLGGRWRNMARVTIANADCSLVAAGLSDSRVVQVEDEIVTSYPFMARRWLDQEFGNVPNNIRISYVPKGSVEAYVRLGVGDAIVDIRESGKTLLENGFSYWKEIEPITTEMIWRDPSKQPEPELDVAGLYAALARIRDRKVLPGTYRESRWKVGKTLTQLMFNDPNEVVKKFGSESAEWTAEFATKSGEGLVAESQDVLYSMAVGLESLDRNLIEALNRL